MTIVFKEFCGDHNMLTAKQEGSGIKFKESECSCFAPKPDTLMCEVEAIHAYPYATRNFTRYHASALKATERQWGNPYRIPVIKHHRDADGDIIGRVYDATYTESTRVKGPDGESVGGLVLTLAIPDKEAAEQVENSLLDTVSIGVEADDVRCSICGERLESHEGCSQGHVRGATYDGETCYFDIYKCSPKEISFVVVPSDVHAGKTRIYRAKDNNLKTSLPKAEAQDNNLPGGVKMTEAENNSINGDTKKMDLEKQVAELNEKVKELEAKLAEAEKSVEELEALKTAKKADEEKLAEIKALLDEKEKAVEAKDGELAEEKAKLVVSEETIAEITKAKEAAEEHGMKLEEKFKLFAADTLNDFRRITERRELTDEEVGVRSLESLLISVSDLKEELGGNTITRGISLEEGKVPNPVPPESGAPQKTKHNKNYKVVDLSEGLEKIFSQATSLR